MRIRPRRDDDLPTLVAMLTEQQPGSRYPVRWPLPFPPEQFLVRASERQAWVAEDDETLLGHVSVGDPGDLRPRFAEATGADSFGMVSVLFTAVAARGRGVGARLLDTAVAWTREQGDVPVLDVVPVHEAAAALYASRGWVEVGHDRFDWMETVDPPVPDLVLMALPPYPSWSSTSS